MEVVIFHYKSKKLSIVIIHVLSSFYYLSFSFLLGSLQREANNVFTRLLYVTTCVVSLLLGSLS